MPQPQSTPVVTFQGIDVPVESVQPDLFFKLTRRHRNPEVNRAFAGLGLTDVIELKKSDIISTIKVRFAGSLVVTPGTGTVATTMRWPYDLVKQFQFIANGQSNLHNYSGLKAKLRAAIADTEFSDRGISQTVGAATVNQGTLAQASESWGVGAGASALAAGTYDVELEWTIAVAEDDRDLAGAIYAQTSTMDLTLNVAYESASNLFVLTGNGAASLTGNIVVETEKFSIPVVGGKQVLPDLSLFHSVIQTRVANYLATGENEVRIVGQGAGKQLLRMPFQVWNGAAPQTPLAMNATNYGSQSWRYGTNETPETYQDGRSLRMINEREYGVDIGGVWGFGCHEFAKKAAFRDTVDMGQTSELRLVIDVQSGVALTSPVLEYVTETIFSSGN